jgi:hypothetical protein
LALYLLSGAAVALGVAFNWNWLTAAALFRVVAVLPCALMMWLRRRSYPIRNNRCRRMAIEKTAISCRQNSGQRIATSFLPIK